MGLLSKGQKLDPKNLKREKFALPEHGKDCYVFIRALSKREGDEFMAAAIKLKEDTDKQKAAGDSIDVVAVQEVDRRLLALCLVDGDGEPIYTDAADVEASFEASADSVKRIEERILKLSGLDQKDRSGK